ncbi:hypothetical protein C5O78_08950 [Treponema phagedenis]|nr:hypothetical protein C5O78_08950 [Treponema phagedenis]
MQRLVINLLLCKKKQRQVVYGFSITVVNCPPLRRVGLFLIKFFMIYIKYIKKADSIAFIPNSASLHGRVFIVI